MVNLAMNRIKWNKSCLPFTQNDASLLFASPPYINRADIQFTGLWFLLRHKATSRKVAGFETR
jgi:hypothetical protein